MTGPQSPAPQYTSDGEYLPPPVAAEFGPYINPTLVACSERVEKLDKYVNRKVLNQ